jgi:2',3'-cyclic-nucleotide 2'-phosphodiesterase (5'-nucleotidase family)
MRFMVKFLIICLPLWSFLYGGEVFFVLTSDLHGNLEHFAYLAPVIRRYPQAVKIDAGDMFQGSFHVNKADGLPVLKALDILGYELAVLGNHDLEYPLETMQLWQRSFSGTLMGGQWKLKNLSLPNRLIVERNGYKIGIISLGDVGTEKRTVYWHDLSYCDETATVRSAVDALKKERCQAFILVAHISGGNFGTLNSIVRDVPEIDVIAYAHSHRSVLGKRTGRALVVQADSHGKSAILFKLNFDKDGKLSFVRSEKLLPAEFPDVEIMKLVVGNENNFPKLTEFAEAAEFGAVSAEILRRAAGAEAAFFRFPQESFPAHLTEKTLFELLPFGNRIVKITAEREALRKFIKKRRRKNKKFFSVGNFSGNGKITVAVSDHFFLSEKDLQLFQAREVGKFERDEILKALKNGEYRKIMHEKVEKSPSGTTL